MLSVNVQVEDHETEALLTYLEGRFGICSLVRGNGWN
jgi:hypothetical protein